MESGATGGFDVKWGRSVLYMIMHKRLLHTAQRVDLSPTAGLSHPHRTVFVKGRGGFLIFARNDDLPRLVCFCS